MRKRRKKRRIMAALFIACILAAGIWGMWEVSQIMADGTRSGQTIAAFSVREGVAHYTLLGQSGELSLFALRDSLREACASLPSGGRLLVWGREAASVLWQEYLLPLGERYLLPLLRELPGA